MTRVSGIVSWIGAEMWGAGGKRGSAAQECPVVWLANLTTLPGGGESERRPLIRRDEMKRKGEGARVAEDEPKPEDNALT